jgi:hypothetical protein
VSWVLFHPENANRVSSKQKHEETLRMWVENEENFMREFDLALQAPVSDAPLLNQHLQSACEAFRTEIRNLQAKVDKMKEQTSTFAMTLTAAQRAQADLYDAFQHIR